MAVAICNFLFILAVEAWRPAIETKISEQYVDSWIQPPRPTSANQQVNLLRRQASAPNSICAYVSGLENDPVTCNGLFGDYCGYQFENSAFGCCSTYFTTQGVVSLTSCHILTACYDSASISASCGPSCQENPQNLICSESDYPYCVDISITNNGLIGHACSTAASLILAGTSYQEVLQPSNTSNLASTTTTESQFSISGSSQTPIAPPITTVTAYTRSQSTVGTRTVRPTISSSGARRDYNDVRYGLQRIVFPAFIMVLIAKM